MWNDNNNTLEKTLVFKDFLTALRFINAIAPEAEKINHHPDILLHSYNKVTCILSTHDTGKVTPKDWALAHIIDSISKTIR